MDSQRACLQWRCVYKRRVCDRRPVRGKKRAAFVGCAALVLRSAVDMKRFILVSMGYNSMNDVEVPMEGLPFGKVMVIDRPQQARQDNDYVSACPQPQYG